MKLSFGKMLKILRVYNSETSIDMAKKLNMSVSYLSSIENSKRRIPDDFLQKLFLAYDISKDKQEEFKKAAELAQDEIIIKTKNLDTYKKEFALLCARKIEKLSDNQISELINIIKIENGR